MAQSHPEIVFDSGRFSMISTAAITTPYRLVKGDTASALASLERVVVTTAVTEFPRGRTNTTAPYSTSPGHCQLSRASATLMRAHSSGRSVAGVARLDPA